MKDGEILSMRLAAELAESLRAQAEKEDRSVSSLLRIIIREGLERRGAQ